MRKTMKSLLFLLCASTVSVPFAMAQRPLQVNVETPNVKGLEYVDDNFSVHIFFQNETDHLILIKDIELEIPRAFVGGERSNILQFNKGALTVEAHASQEAEAQVPAVAFTKLFAFAFFHSRPYSALIRFTEEDPSGGQSSRKGLEVPLNAQSPWIAVVLGGFIGVPITIAFFSLYERFSGLGKTGKPFWLSLLLGWLVVAIAVLVFRFGATTIPQLPIAIHVKDFYGGLMIGGSFEPLSLYFYKARSTP